MDETVIVPTAASVNPEEILELLWARVRERGELPGFSKAVSAILGAMRGDDVADSCGIRIYLTQVERAVIPRHSGKQGGSARDVGSGGS